ncbi:MAG TPA: L-seryl-tRNA(Sec) selenium transferase [Herpetosiphonaceae bacterium]
MSNTAHRALPSVDRLVRAVEEQINGTLPHAEVVQVARMVLDTARRTIAQGEAAPSFDELAGQVRETVARLTQPSLRPLINATGVIVQTNLGRAPLSAAALSAMQAVGRGYSNLEYDLAAGARGSRYHHLTELLARLTGAEAALAVNNNAAAVLLTLTCFCAGKEVIISRGQAVEIGGGFRIPDVLRQSGARLVEVGTTNRTYTHDYAAAITPDTAAILTVHRSNFRVVGFTHEPHEMELHHLAHEAGVLWIDDWGSGSLLRPEHYGLAAEDTIQDRVAAGCDLVCFSGDKLLGGPQAGLIVGAAELIGRLRKHPLLRALRVDKLTIAALEATLLSYLRGRAEEEIPVWQMISAPLESLHSRAVTIVERLRGQGLAAVEARACESAVGGGSLPGATLPGWAVAISALPDPLHARLRGGDPVVVGRIADDRLLLDLRTVLPDQDDALIQALLAALHEESRRS